MRRKDREVTDKSAIESFIKRQQIIRVGFADSDGVYIVPVNYGFAVENGVYAFYFHGAKAGRKYELAKAEPTVGFEIDGEYELVRSETACGYTASFMSVIGTGRLTLARSNTEKAKGLDCLMRHISGQDGFSYPAKTLENTAVFKLTVEALSCKEKK